MNKRPLVKTFLTPEKIIFTHHDLVKKHFQTAAKCNSDNFDSRTDKIFEPAERDLVGDIYEKLRQQGYYITGIDKGKLKIKQLVSNDGVLYLPGDFFLDEPKPSKAEIIQMRKKCNADIETFKKNSKMPSPDPEDFDLSDVPY